MDFLLRFFAPRLRSLSICQKLEVALDLPHLKYLDHSLPKDSNGVLTQSGGLALLPSLKHLVVNEKGAFAYVAPLTVNLEILEVSGGFDEGADIESYESALKLLRRLRVLIGGGWGRG